MGKKVIYERFNAITGRWEERSATESEWLSEMKVLDNEKEVLDSELEIVNNINEQHLNEPIEVSKLVESKD